MLHFRGTCSITQWLNLGFSYFFIMHYVHASWMVQYCGLHKLTLVILKITYSKIILYICAIL